MLIICHFQDFFVIVKTRSGSYKIANVSQPFFIIRIFLFIRSISEALEQIKGHVFSIFNYVDMYYKWVDTRVVVSDIQVWKDGNKIIIDPSNPNITIAALGGYTNNVVYKSIAAQDQVYVGLICRFFPCTFPITFEKCNH